MCINNPAYVYRMGNERLGERPLHKLTVPSLMKSSAELALIWRMTWKIWKHMGRIVEKSGCGCLGRKIQMVEAAGVERKRRKQTIADNQWNLKVANLMY